MNMQNPLQKLADAVAAREGSPARERLLQLFDAGTFVEIDRLALTGTSPPKRRPATGRWTARRSTHSRRIPRLQRRCRPSAGGEDSRRFMSWPPRMARPSWEFSTATAPSWAKGIDAMDAIAEMLLASNNLSGVVPQIAVLAGACVGSSVADRRQLGSWWWWSRTRPII